MKKMLTIGKKVGLGLVALTACAATAAPFLPLALGSSGDGRVGDEGETTISVRGELDESPTVLHVDRMRVGEVQTATSSSGKPVVITRTDEGFTIKVGEKEFKVNAGGDDDSLSLEGGPGGPTMRKIIVMDGSKSHGSFAFSGDDDGSLPRKIVVGDHAFAYKIGGGDSKSFHDMLAEQKLKSLEGLDARTKDAVVKALEELSAKGVVIAPNCDLPMRVSADGKDGGHVEIKVIRTK